MIAAEEVWQQHRTTHRSEWLALARGGGGGRVQGGCGVGGEIQKQTRFVRTSLLKYSTTLTFYCEINYASCQAFLCFSSRTQNTKLCTFSHLKGWSLCFPSLEHKDGRRRTPGTTCSPSPIRKTSTLTNNKQTQVSKEHLSGLLLAYCIKSAFVILILKLIL